MQNNVSVTINNCSFMNNKARAGGALAAGFNVTLQLDHCTFQANVATYTGAAIGFTSNVMMHMSNSLFLSNTGGIAVIRSDNQTYIHLDNCSIINNTG